MSFARRTRRGSTRRGAAVVDTSEAVDRLAACRCPFTVTTGAGLTTIEHWHRHGCKALRRYRDRP